MSGTEPFASVAEAAAAQPAIAESIPSQDPPSSPPPPTGVVIPFTEAADRQAALRALRNLEATEARLQRSAQRDAEHARGKLVQDLLPVLDNLDRTIRAAHANRGHTDTAMLEGIRLVRHQLEGVLRGYGVERLDAIDQPFDPSLHEAIGVTPVADPRHHGVVVQQAEPGYRFAGKLLRPAKVNVGKLVAQAPTPHYPMWR